MSQRRLSAVLACSLALAMMVVTAAAQNQNAPSPPPRANPNPPVASASDIFLVKAIEINSAEVELGKLAAMKAQNPRVKSYADMLVKDHSAALEKLRKLHPGDGNVALSTEHEKLKMRLSELSGPEFDREYMDAMVKGHIDAVKLFEQQIGSTATAGSAAGGSNVEVNKVARELLPTIREHLKQGELIQISLTQQAR
jgi:putative membrane protein